MPLTTPLEYTYNMEALQPEIFVLGGPNGAGKTTVAGLLLPDSLGVANFVNADFIAQALSPHAPQASAMDAGRNMLHRIRELRERRETFGFETTLASKTFAPFLREARVRGYLVHIIYVWLASPDLAVHRVRLRVQRGGHDIPEDTIRRRYLRSVVNFFQLYQPLSDTWRVCDNSEEVLTDVAYSSSGAKVTVENPTCWERVLRQGSTDEHRE